MRSISLVSNFLVFTLVFTHSVLDSTLDIVLRHVLALRISDDSAQCWIVLWLGTTCLYSNSNLLTNLGKGLCHVSPSLKLRSFTIFKCSSHIYSCPPKLGGWGSEQARNTNPPLIKLFILCERELDVCACSDPKPLT